MLQFNKLALFESLSSSECQTNQASNLKLKHGKIVCKLSHLNCFGVYFSNLNTVCLLELTCLFIPLSL